MEMMYSNHANTQVQYRARCIESLVEGHYWILPSLLKISSLICSLSLLAKAGLNLSPFEISRSWPLSQDTVDETTLQYHFLHLWLS